MPRNSKWVEDLPTVTFAWVIRSTVRLLQYEVYNILHLLQEHSDFCNLLHWLPFQLKYIEHGLDFIQADREQKCLFILVTMEHIAETFVLQRQCVGWYCILHCSVPWGLPCRFDRPDVGEWFDPLFHRISLYETFQELMHFSGAGNLKIRTDQWCTPCNVFFGEACKVGSAIPLFEFLDDISNIRECCIHRGWLTGTSQISKQCYSSNMCELMLTCTAGSKSQQLAYT